MFEIEIKKKYSKDRNVEIKTGIYSLITTLIFISILLLVFQKNPLIALYYIIFSNASSLFNITEIFVRATPLLLVSLGTLIAFRAKFWNLAGDAQFYLGALLTTVVGLMNLPSGLHPVVGLVIGALAGSLIGLLTSFLKVKLKTDEVVITLMLNFITFYFLSLLLQTVMKNPSTNWPESEYIRNSAKLPVLIKKTRLHLGIVLTFLILPFMNFLLNQTIFGREIVAIGLNPKAARLNKINIERNLLKVGFLSGFFCGLAGAIEVLGIHHHLTTSISANYGIYGVIISMASRLSVYGASILAVLFSFIINGSTSLTRFMQIPSFIADVISSFVLISVSVFMIFEKYKLVVKWKK